MLSREFQRLRDDVCKLYQSVPIEQRPSFHELRALGGDLYREAGWTKEQVQALYGHTTSKMTDAYLDGHRVRWVDAEAG